jgi:hypothetical protein
MAIVELNFQATGAANHKNLPNPLTDTSIFRQAD